MNIPNTKQFGLTDEDVSKMIRHGELKIKMDAGRTILSFHSQLDNRHEVVLTSKQMERI